MKFKKENAYECELKKTQKTKKKIKLVIPLFKRVKF